MKKIALLLLMFVAFQVSAQDFHFLPKIGLNLANMTNSDGSMKPGLNVGVAAEFPINPQFSVEPEYLIRWRHHIKWQLHELGWGEIPQWRPADQPRLEILKYPLAGIKSDRHPF